VGPIFVGYLFDQTHSWTMPIVLLIAALIVMGAAGQGAGRDRYIFQSEKQRNSA
ncbi:MAG: MFS transporter, partial [Bacillota bacterium]|nr:MFS transporter [Bacillota bacterium]